MDDAQLAHYRARFDAFKLVKVQNVFGRAEQDRILDDIEALTGIRDADLDDVLAGRVKTYNSPGTMARNEAFWPIIYHPNIVTLMRALVGDDMRFQGGDNLSVHWVNSGFHRDIHIDVTKPPGWDPNFAQFRIGRFLAYLNREGAPPNHFAFVPFSHQANPPIPDVDGMTLEDLTSWYVVLSLNPGDCLVFDPRIMHTGGTIEGPKHMISLSYGPPNEYTIDSYFYGRVVRTDEGYTDLPDELIARLRARNLFLEEMLDPVLWQRYEDKYRGEEKGDPESIDRTYRRDATAAERAQIGGRAP